MQANYPELSSTQLDHEESSYLDKLSYFISEASWW